MVDIYVLGYEIIEIPTNKNVYTEIYSKKDLSGNDRIVIARLKSR